MKEIKFDLVGRNVKFNEIQHEVVTLQQLLDGNFNRSTVSSFFDTNNDNCDFLATRQCTGLKDCTGKDIYEGDILVNVDDISYGHTVPKNTMFEIVFAITGGCAGLWLYSKVIDTVPFDISEVARLVFNDDEGSEWFKVVGNIYDDKDLWESGI